MNFGVGKWKYFLISRALIIVNRVPRVRLYIFRTSGRSPFSTASHTPHEEEMCSYGYRRVNTSHMTIAKLQRR